ncbi:MAG: OmpA family protein [Pseudomonas sp.]
MKLKNTLGFAIGSVVAATSFGVLAQGQGAVEGELFYSKTYNDSVKHVEDGRSPGISAGYFITDDVEVILGYQKHDYTRSDNADWQKINGDKTTLTGMYHFGTVGDAIRPYVSGGFAHQSMTNVAADGHTGRDSSTFAQIGAGAKWYITDNLYARAGVEADYKLDNGKWDYAPTIGLGVNFGGGSKPAPAPAPAPAPEPVAEAPVEAAPQVVRVQLDVKFDFNKSVVKPNSYADIKNLADFMKQYPQTTTTVEGHTDNVGPDAYNQKLSERRATAVKTVLVNQYGVGAGRVSSVGYGESRPVADNKTEAGRAINRRVEAEVEAKAQ